MKSDISLTSATLRLTLTDTAFESVSSSDQATVCTDLKLARSADSLTSSQMPPTRIPHLPTELHEKILDSLLIFDQPIEFAPQELHRNNMDDIRLDAYGYQHALRYRRSILPALKTLRVCKAWHEMGSRRYYSENAFRFSNVRGWMALLQFLKLIGSKNRCLLRDITVCHPALHVPCVRAQEVPTLFNLLLGPFGLTEPGDGEVVKWLSRDPTSDFVYSDYFHSVLLTQLLIWRQGENHCWLPDSHGERICDIALIYIHSITELRSLRFLVFGKWPAPYPNTNWFWERTDGLTTHHVNYVEWNHQPNLTISLVNLIPRDHSEFIPLKVEDTLDFDPATEVDPSLKFSEPQIVQNAKEVFEQARTQGWDVLEMSYASCGSYPVMEYPVLAPPLDGRTENCSSHYEEAEDTMERDPIREWAESFSSILEDHVDGHPHRGGICKLCTEDFHGYWNRDSFQCKVSTKLRGWTCGEDAWGHDDTGMQFDVCVRCWRHDPCRTDSDLVPTCTCDDGGTYINEDWRTTTNAIGNPGVPISVNVTRHGDNVTWAKVIR